MADGPTTGYHRGDLVRMVYQHGVVFTGTADAIVAAGLWLREQLPGAPGQNKIAITRNLGDGRKTKAERRSARRFRVYVSIEELHHRHPGFPEFLARVLEPVGS